jgi:hypothetical protein
VEALSRIKWSGCKVLNVVLKVLIQLRRLLGMAHLRGLQKCNIAMVQHQHVYQDQDQDWDQAGNQRQHLVSQAEYLVICLKSSNG